MQIRRFARSVLVLAVASIVLTGGQTAMGQIVRVEAGGGWAIPSSSVDMHGQIEGTGQSGTINVDPGWGPHGYAAAGLEWTVSSNFALAGFVRIQQSWMRGDKNELSSPFQLCQDGGCTVSQEPDGRLRAATLEGRLVLTSVGRIEPYFLVGLGVVSTTVEGGRVEGPQDGFAAQFEDAQVTDAGGDVGFGAFLRLVEDLSLTGEIRASGSLPGAKENAVTTFPFSLGLSYGF